MPSPEQGTSHSTRSSLPPAPGFRVGVSGSLRATRALVRSDCAPWSETNVSLAADPVEDVEDEVEVRWTTTPCGEEGAGRRIEVAEDGH